MSDPIHSAALRALARQILDDALNQPGPRAHASHVREMATRIGALEQAVRVAITLLDTAGAGEGQ
ncbi:hypothetical protein [Streptomyces heilongjiangensis]|uniref:Phosphatase n=1 Tax=Streptomyces heilongjiangensis TaxID=945052 RepID=A0ABW1BCQ0_9ACTN|nr:hypothetical protein [Streptomyces heilongjiangensis]MDC2952040.1 hypothetical protein [Streptomyces heilongjiangensis]